LLRFSLLGLASLLVILVIAGAVLGVVLVRRPFPQYSGEVSIPGLRSSVAVQRDGHGVPQVYADNAEDLFRAQGYVQAQDQFFTMDWRRHVTSGRLSELVGDQPDALAADKLIRTLGWRQVAEAELQQLDPVSRGYLDAYAAGVNDYLAGRSASQLSLGYTVLSLQAPLSRIEPWTPADSLAWFQAMAWQLRGDYDDELSRARVLGAVKDPSRVKELYPDYPYNLHQPILSSDSLARLTGGSGSGASSASASGGVAGVGTSGGVDGGGTSGGAVRSGSVAKTGVTRTGKVTAAKVPATPGGTAGQPGSVTPAQAKQMDFDSAALDRAVREPDAQGVIEQARRAVSAVPAVLGSGRAVGANAWVVSGSKTATGKPLLADDPQLSASLPGIWYQMGLHCRRVTDGCPFDVSGFTYAGVPGVVIGHNARISWGLSSLGPDVTDYYLERVDGGTYQRDGAWPPITTRKETLNVAGGSPVTFAVRSTVHGPIVSDLIADSVGPGTAAGQPRDHQYAVSIAWSALQPGHDLPAVFALDRAGDFTAFRAAAQQFDVPAQNFVFADVDGHIGYTVSGRIPVRRSTPTMASAQSTSPDAAPAAPPATPPPATPSAAGGSSGATTDQGTTTPPSGPSTTSQAAKAPALLPSNGTWPVPGWNSSFDWAGFVPSEQLPWVLDPSDGLIVAANQPVTPPSYPVKLASDWDYGYRAQRIRDLVSGDLKAGHKLTVADVQSIQGDTYNPVAARLVPLLLQVKTDSSFAFTEQARALLKGWKYDQPPNSPAAAYFNAVWARLLDIAFGDELPEGARPDGGQRWFEVVRHLLDEQKNPWWDDKRTPDVVESETEDLRQAMIQARLDLTRILGKDPQRWQWGHLHQLRLTGEPLGDLGVTSVLHPLLNQGPIEVGGGSSLVDAMGWDASSGAFDSTTFNVIDAPSMRMIVDLANLDGSRWVNATGVSSHPGQAHYADQVDAWARNETYPWPFSSGAVGRTTTDTLTLKGAG
jgi:penicillin amidase